MKVVGEEYSKDSLKEFSKLKRKNQTIINFENYKLLDENSNILNLYNQLAIRLK